MKKRNQKTILIADNDQLLAGVLRRKLQSYGFQVKISFSKASTLYKIREGIGDVICLSDNIAEHTEDIKEIFSSGGVNCKYILLTKDRESQKIVTYFKAGADDVLSKPFTPEELGIRVQNTLRMRQKQEEERIVKGIYTLFIRAQKLTIGSHLLFLTQKECILTEQLLITDGVVTSEQLLQALKRANFSTTLNNLRVSMSRLRFKAEIKTGYSLFKYRRGVGYFLLS